MAAARRHHYISQFYLRNFVTDRGNPRLYVVDLPGRKTFATSPSNVALENDFHTISTPGQEPDIVEKRLAKFESEVAPALARVIEGESLGSGEDAQLVLFFATLLHVKAPSQRNIFDDFAHTLMTNVSKGDEYSGRQARDDI